MHLTFWIADKGYEGTVGRALMEGIKRCGDTVEMMSVDSFRAPDGDAGIVFGVVRREILWAYQQSKRPLIYFDKGYTRARMEWEGKSLPMWWRACWQDVHPTAYLMRHNYNTSRWCGLDINLPQRVLAPRGHVVILGSSAKFHHTMHLPHPTDWAQDLVDHVAAQQPGRAIIYRPKPSWRDAVRVRGAKFDWVGENERKTPLAHTMLKAHCAITYGSIAAVDAINMGVPVITLGNAVTKALGSTSLHALAAPKWPERPLLAQWAANLAYHQWTPAELKSGEAWSIIKEQRSYAF